MIPMTLVLFPLSAHLLPGGIMPLRIFEPRYQRMIAESREREFALCMLDPRQPDALRNMYPIATRVRIIDFDLLPDGLLGITVLGVEPGLTHQCLYFEQPHTFEQILFIQTAEPALVGHA
jgi:Lon protease-like protein